MKNNKQISFTNLSKENKKVQKEIYKEIKDILQTSSFILSEQTKEFEKNFSSYIETNYAKTVCNGTLALEVALRSLDIGSGDEVILPVNTFIATAEAVSNVGATPVFVDVEKKSLQIDTEDVKDKITSRSKAIIGVHLFGFCCNVYQLKDIAEDNNLLLIEDTAQAHGAEKNGNKCGSIGDVSCFSFYPSKNLGAIGEGGAVVTDKDEINKKVHMLRDHGKDKDGNHVLVGSNYRMSNLQAAVLNIKLDYLEQWNSKRREIFNWYKKRLLEIKEVNIVKPKGASKREDDKYVHHLFIIRANRRGKLQNFLEDKSIETGLHYEQPLHLTEAYSSLNNSLGDFPIAEQASNEILSLPMDPFLKKEDVSYVVNQIKEFYEQN